MSAPMSVNPETKVSNSCNNWFCCTKKKSTKSSKDIDHKVQEVAEKYRRGSHQTDYTIDYDSVHVKVHTHLPAIPE